MAFVNLPPNFQDIFAKIDDRISKLETGPNQAMYTAVTANVVAVQALNEASQALAQATQAYNVGSQALIKDSNTITNASNQLTGINGNGITVYSGNLNGARVVLNSLGLTGYDGSGTPTFAIAASTGQVSTTGAIFTSSTISGGSLNINGNAIINSSGFLTATGATITGTITATSGSFAGTITSTSGSIGGFTLGTNFLSGGGTTLSAATGQISAGGLITANNGVSASSLAMSGNISMGANNINNAATIGCATVNASAASTFSGITSGTNTNSFTSQFNYSGIATGSGSTMVLVSTGSRVAYTTSSERFKEQIQYLEPTGWVEKVEGLRPITYVTSEDFTTEGEPNPTQLGLLAEDVADLANELGMVVVNDPLGDPFSLSYERLTPALILAVKELSARVKELESKI